MITQNRAMSSFWASRIFFFHYLPFSAILRFFSAFSRGFSCILGSINIMGIIYGSMCFFPFLKIWFVVVFPFPTFNSMWFSRIYSVRESKFSRHSQSSQLTWAALSRQTRFSQQNNYQISSGLQQSFVALELKNESELVRPRTCVVPHYVCCTVWYRMYNVWLPHGNVMSSCGS